MRASGIAETLAARIQRSAVGKPGALFVGLSGPQGSGKSTLAAGLAERLGGEGLRVALLSLDDLYLDRSARAALALGVHPLFATRGVPGTHDMALAQAVFDSLGQGEPVRLPRFDKASDNPLAQDQWPLFEGPADVVLLEGWCVGARSQTDGALVTPVNALEREDDSQGVWRRAVNTRLAGTYQDLFARLDIVIQLRPPSFGVVTRWRTEQEHALKVRLASEGASPARAMSDEAVVRFVQHYERLTRHMLTPGGTRADILVDLDEARQGVAIKDFMP